MSSENKHKMKHQVWGRSYQILALVFGVVLLIATVESRTPETVAEKSSLTANAMPAQVSLEETDGISHYHCSGGGSTSNAISLVLLHGSRFTKEDWKNPPGILENFCSRSTNQKLDVFAVDLPVKADYKDLAKLLDSMEKEGKISKPVSLVTPSASGRTMVTWAGASESWIEKLPEYIKQWIPVAALSVNHAPDGDIQRLTDLPILAIYGDQDSPGRDCSKKLERLAGAHVLEQHGRHPCYFDSPKEFVDEVVKFIDT